MSNVHSDRRSASTSRLVDVALMRAAAAPNLLDDEVDALVGEVRRSPHGAWLLGMLASERGLPEIRIVPDVLMDAVTGSGDVLGDYDRRRHVVRIRRSVVTERPSQAVMTTAHELYHALDNVLGISPSVAPALDAQYRAAGWLDDIVRRRQVARHSMLVTEARAYTFAARVGHELGYSSAGRGPVTTAAMGGETPAASYVAAWNALLRRDDAHGSFPVIYAPGTSAPY